MAIKKYIGLLNNNIIFIVCMIMYTIFRPSLVCRSRHACYRLYWQAEFFSLHKFHDKVIIINVIIPYIWLQKVQPLVEVVVAGNRKLLDCRVKYVGGLAPPGATVAMKACTES